MARTTSGGFIADLSRQLQLIDRLPVARNQDVNLAFSSRLQSDIRAYLGAITSNFRAYAPGSSPRC